MILCVLQVVWRVLDELVCFRHKRGTAAARDAARTPNTTTATIMTAAHRGSFRWTSHDTAGWAPNAKNKATPINTSTDDARPRMRTAPYVTATPAEAVNPK